MNTSIRTAIIGSAAALAVGLGVTVATTGAGAATGSASVTGRFAGNLVGYSNFVETGNQITVKGTYSLLRPNSAYFTVAYGNVAGESPTCDPAAAFPVGPFTANLLGVASLNKTVPDPVGGIVAGTTSVSVRIGDNATDIDKDGKTGPSDVVAVPNSGTARFPANPNNYRIGLVQCDRSPHRP